MNKLDFTKELFEYDKGIIKQLMGVLYKDVSFEELPHDAIKYYRLKANEIIKLVNQINE